MTTAPATPARARMPLSLWIVAVVLPLIAGLVFVALQLAWLPQLPEPIAIHWTTEGPDGFAPAWTSPVFTGGLSLGLVAMFAIMLATARGPAPTVTHKLLAAISLTVAVFTGGTMTATLGVQRGLDDARDAGDITGWMLLGLACAVALACAAWFLMPKAVASAPQFAATDPLPLAPGERGVWIARSRLAGGSVAAVVSAIGVASASVVFAVAVSDGQLWPLLAVPVLLLAMCAAALSWRVRVDTRGLSVRSMPFGWPRVTIPASEIARVETSHVEPLAEFGGWGWRWAPGRSFGVVTRRGEAIEVTRRDGRRFTVTVDDAATGAALLAASVDTARQAGAGGS